VGGGQYPGAAGGQREAWEHLAELPKEWKIGKKKQEVLELSDGLGVELGVEVPIEDASKEVEAEAEEEESSGEESEDEGEITVRLADVEWNAEEGDDMEE
jgi:hypothetical protein